MRVGAQYRFHCQFTLFITKKCINRFLLISVIKIDIKFTVNRGDLKVRKLKSGKNQRKMAKSRPIILKWANSLLCFSISEVSVVRNKTTKCEKILGYFKAKKVNFRVKSKETAKFSQIFLSDFIFLTLK